jgi:hypothetical protein
MREYDSLISNPQKQSEFLKKYGPEQYEIALDYYSQKADEEINSAYTAYQTAVQQTKLSTLQKYGLDARYSDSYEDKIRKLAGAVPISFDISKYIPTTEGMTWDDQSVDLALSACKKPMRFWRRLNLGRQAHRLAEKRTRKNSGKTGS